MIQVRQSDMREEFLNPARKNCLGLIVQTTFAAVLVTAQFVGIRILVIVFEGIFWNLFKPTSGRYQGRFWSRGFGGE